MNIVQNKIRRASLVRQEPEWLVDRRVAAAERLDAPPAVRRGQGTPLPWSTFSWPVEEPDAAGVALCADARVRVEPLSAALADPFGLDAYTRISGIIDRRSPHVAAWQEAYGIGEFFVSVPEATEVAAPVVLNSRAAEVATGRHLVCVGAGSRVTVIVNDDLSGGRFAGQLDVVAGPGARVEVVRFESGEGQSSWGLRADLAEGATLTSAVIVAGRGFRQLRAAVALRGTGSAWSHRVGALGRGLLLDEAAYGDALAANTHADVAGAFVLGSGDKTASHGRVSLHRVAAHATGRQRAAALLLESGADFSASPDLEAENDAVRCSHAASVGGPDKERLFYLQSRGLSRPAALGLLVTSRFREVEASFAKAGREAEISAIINGQLKEMGYAV